MRNLLTLTILAILGWSCASGTDEKNDMPPAEELPIADLNEPAPGFDLKNSDPIAIMKADKVMKAMGGRKAWDETRYLSWNFFGRRQLLWDKKSGNVRIEIPSDSLKILVNVDEMTGKIRKAGIELTDSTDYYLDLGRKIWINDSYWLVMPFKLKDSGVTLNYVREDTTMSGESADVLRLTFDNVGVTPQNAYEVWVSSEDDLIKQWAFYRNASDSVAGFVLPWTDYQQKGDILLSGERGDNDLTDIKVYDELPESIFTDFEGSIQSL